MTYQLTPDQDRLLQTAFENGAYSNHSEAITDALTRLVEHQNELRDLRDKLRVASEQVERGETILWTPELMEEIKQRAIARYEAGERSDRHE